MKKLNLLTILSAALILTSAGCKHQATGITEIPDRNDSSRGTVTTPLPTPPPTTGNTLPGGGGTVETTPPVAVTPEGPASDKDNGQWKTVIETGTPDTTTLKDDAVYFDFDSSTVRTSEQKKLEDVSNYLKNHMADALRVEGNCDERGTEKYNLALGDKRALAVREYLINLGINGHQVVTVTYGAMRPADPGHNDKAWAKNRRGDFVLLVPKAQ